MGATNDDSSSEGSGRPVGPKRHCTAKAALCNRLCGRGPQVNILDNATGQAKMGELVGVLGPSGALNFCTHSDPYLSAGLIFLVIEGTQRCYG